MLNAGLPFIPGYSSLTGGHRKTIPRAKALFHTPEPSGKPTYLKFLNDRDIFKNKNAPTLKFYASFDDRGEPPRDRLRFRDCHVLYFVEDGTIKVYEPKQRNSGMTQGCIIGRNMIPKADGRFYNLDDFKIGDTLVFYGKSFKLVDCDPFTKNFLREMGYRVRTPEPPPVDPVTADRFEANIPSGTSRKSFQKQTEGELFLKKFPKCLHFYGIYNRTNFQFEEEFYVSLYYQLYDGRIKIIDDKNMFDRHIYPMKRVFKSYYFLKPTHVPKQLKITTLGQIGRGRTILNLSGKTKDTRFKRTNVNDQDMEVFLRDPNAVNDQPVSEYLKPEDLDLGKTIDVFGAKVFLYDCDEYTKQYYKYEFDKVLSPISLPHIEPSKSHLLVYPQNFSCPVDTLSGWKVEGLKAPAGFVDLYDLSSKMSSDDRSKHLLKFHLNCRDGCDGNVLRFLARILTNDCIKKTYVYVIDFFLEDDTISVTKFNPDEKKDLKFGDKYLRRMKVPKPTTNPLNSNSCLYHKTDFFVGNVICINTERFSLFDADEYTFEYMSEKSNEFCHSNILDLMQKFRTFFREHACSLQAVFESADKCNSGEICYDAFRAVIRQHLPQEESILIPEQEIITLARFYCHEDYIGFHMDDLASKIQMELKRQGFQDFDKLKEQFEMFDLKYGSRTGFLSNSHVYEILLSCPLNVNKDLLKFFILKFPKKDGLIDYRKAIECLDYIGNPCKKPCNTPYQINLNWSEVEYVKNIDRINYRSFLKNITREDCPECKF